MPQQTLQERLESIRGKLPSSSDAPSASPSPSTPAPTDSDQPGVAGQVVRDVAQGVRDVPTSVWRGVTNAVNEFGKTSLAIDQWVSKNITGGYLEIGGDEGFINWVRGVPKDVNIEVPEQFVPDRSRSTTGQLIEGVSQFVTGLLTLGKFTAPIKGLQTLGTAGRLAFSAAKGAVVDLTVFDAYEDRLSNLIQEHPDLANPVTEYLASNEDDSALKARFKAAVEGAVLGGIADTFVEGLRVLKSSRALRDAPAAARAKAEQELIDTLTDADAIINRQADAKFDVVETKDGFRIVADGTSELHPQIFTTREAASAETGVLNMLELDSKRMRAPGKLTDEEVGAIRKETQRLLESDDPEDIAQLLIGTDFNFRYARNEKGALAFIEAISKVMKDEISNIKGGTVVTHERLLRQVKSTFPDGDPQKIMTALSKTFKNSETLNVDTAAGRIWMHKVGMEVSRLSKIVDGTPDSPVAMDQLGAALDHLFAVQSQLKGVSTNVARTLEAHKIDPTNITDVVTNKPNPTGSMVDGPRAQQIAKDGITSTQGQLTRAALAGMTPDEMRVLARRVRLAEGDPNEILAITRGAKRSDPEAVTPGFIQKFNEFWINGILSGPTTHTVNVVSGLQMALATPLERVAAGVISRDKRLANEGADLLIGNFMSIRESFRGAGKALRTAQNALDPSLPTNELTQDHALGGYLGKLARLPSRFLMAEDEFFKQMNFRSNVRAQALKDARELGLTGTKFAEHVSDTINSAFTPSGLGANKKALDFARKQTFTQPLREGSLAQRAQSAVNDMPALRLVLPFVRTPTNLIHYTWERTPVLRKLHRQVREELAAGGERAAIQQAKLGTGLAVYTGAASLALAGQITGRGPENDGLRKQWLQTHQPYSVKAGDRWVSYRRGDPLMAPVGIVADIVGMGGELDADSAEELATAVASSIAANLSSKTYLQGIVNVMDTLTSGSPNKTGRFLRSFAGSIVPNVLNVSNPDDPFREVRGYVDSMMARTPGLSNTLPARRNIFGEEVMKAPGAFTRTFNPFTISKASGDTVVDDRLLELGKAIPMPSKKAPGTEINLASRQFGTTKGDLTPYDRMLQIVGKGPGNTPPLRARLKELVTSQLWENLSPGVEDIAPGGQRHKLATDVVQSYRQRAYQQVLQEFPELRLAIQQARVTKKLAETQGQSGVERAESLFKGPQQ